MYQEVSYCEQTFDDCHIFEFDFLAYKVKQKVPKAAIFMEGGKGMLKQLNDTINYAEFMNIR